MTHDTASTGSTDTTWRDRKRYLWPLGLLVPLLPFMAWGLVAATGNGLWWWFGPIVVFGAVPVADWALGRDAENPPESEVAGLDADRYYRWCTYLFLPLQFLGLVWACWAWTRFGLSATESLGLAVTVGCVAGIAINTAHELGHKRPAVERWLSKVALAQTGYGHFYVEHNRGHHTWVSTPEDPASSRFGESFYAFFPRTVAGSARSAVRIERERVQRAGRSFWSIRNDVLNAWAMTVVLFGALLAAFGLSIVPWLLVQAVFGFSLLEVVNYIEHYGLLRQKRDNGKYERCLPVHSWNANNRASNLVLYHLQRHSDHHAYPVRRYQSLRHFEKAPQLPTGYAAMIILAYVPPLWRLVMDRRVLAHYDGDITRANIAPRARARVLARYGAGTGAGTPTATTAAA